MTWHVESSSNIICKYVKKNVSIPNKTIRLRSVLLNKEFCPNGIGLCVETRIVLFDEKHSKFEECRLCYYSGNKISCNNDLKTIKNVFFFL